MIKLLRVNNIFFVFFGESAVRGKKFAQVIPTLQYTLQPTCKKKQEKTKTKQQKNHN